MKKLLASSFEKGSSFIKQSARPLDRALFSYVFEQGSKQDVSSALAFYQLEDGGFGRGIEPDFRLEQSSPMATAIAFRFLKGMKIPSDDPMVKKGVQYLLDTYKAEKGRWQALPREVNDAPHAPWWEFDEEAGRTLVEASWGNPTAEITAHLLYYADLVPSPFLAELTDRCIAHFTGLEELGHHETLCYLHLAEQVDEKDREKILSKIHLHLDELVEGNREKWGGYVVQPLGIVHSPKSPFYEKWKQQVQENLDYRVETQQADGSWAPNWHWGQYEEEWEIAKREWEGHLTAINLIQLGIFGRVEYPDPMMRMADIHIEAFL